MGFVDKKERIIDINLTTYGKSLLAKGILNFDHFVLIDNETQYLSSSFDKEIESLPVFECVSTFDNCRNSLFTNPHQYAQTKVNFVPDKFNNDSHVATTSSLLIHRKTKENIYEDPLIYRIEETGSTFSIVDQYNRINSLKTRGGMYDSNCAINCYRIYSNEFQGYEIEMELSNSFGSRKLFCSGSSFGISDDADTKYNKPNVQYFSDNFMEIVSINKKKFPIKSVNLSRSILVD